MNGRAWFYGTSFHGNIDRASYATHQQITEKQVCPLCHKEVDMLVQAWAKLDGKIAHDYCVRMGQ